MNVYNKKEGFILFLGDIAFFVAALWLALFARYLEIPSWELFFTHLVTFSALFAAWVTVYFIAGLYGKHTLIFKSRLPTLLLNTQIVNSTLAVLFFYLIPFLTITPKIVLFVYLVFSFGLILFWRVRLAGYLGFRKKQNAILIGEGEEMKALYEEVSKNPRYALKFVAFIDLSATDETNFKKVFSDVVYGHDVSVVVADIKNKKLEPYLSYLYNLIFVNIQFIDLYSIYMEIFDRVPLSMLRYSWVLQNISPRTHVLYDTMKRAMDIFVGLFVGAFSLILYPFVVLAIKLDDGGSVFISQKRIGLGGFPMNIYKFRTMSGVSREGEDEEGRITRVGSFLRKTRIDELPQLWNVLKGELSIIGPRPELPYFVELYHKEIPYYHVRHIIKPGLSGWAQIHMQKPPKFTAGYDETKTKLSYDLYYIKNRSLMLDVKIALLTIRTLLSRSGI